MSTYMKTKSRQDIIANHQQDTASTLAPGRIQPTYTKRTVPQQVHLKRRRIAKAVEESTLSSSASVTVQQCSTQHPSNMCPRNISVPETQKRKQTGQQRTSGHFPITFLLRCSALCLSHNSTHKRSSIIHYTLKPHPFCCHTVVSCYRTIHELLHSINHTKMPQQQEPPMTHQCVNPGGIKPSWLTI